MLTKSFALLSSVLSVATLSACGAESKSNPEATPDSPAEKAVEAIEPVPSTQGKDTPASEAPRAVFDAPAAYPQALYLADAGSRPVCAQSNEGQLVYLVGAREFQACVAGQWEVVDLRGAQGAAGKDGKDGKDGVSNRIVAKTTCSRITTSSLLIAYEASVMATGDAFVRCSVTDAGRQHSVSLYHADGSQGASDLACNVGYDLDASTGGFVTFATDLGTRSFTVEDNGSTKLDFATEECTTVVY